MSSFFGNYLIGPIYAHVVQTLPASLVDVWYGNSGVTSTAGKISTWVGAVNGKTFVQATTLNQPTYALNTLTIDNATPQYMSLTQSLTQPYAIYIVGSWITAGNGGVFYSDNPFAHLFYAGGSQFEITADTGGNNVIKSGYSSGTDAVLVGYFNGTGTGSAVQLNNTAVVTGSVGTSAAPTSPIHLGATSALVGTAISIKAIYILQSPSGGITGADNTSVRADILSKYGI